MKGKDYRIAWVDTLVLADFIPGPSPKLILKFRVASGGMAENEFVLKNNIDEYGR